MADKDVDGVLEIFAEKMASIVCTGVASTSRGLSPEQLAGHAEEIFGPGAGLHRADHGRRDRPSDRPGG